jgi:hypothetical protein
MARVACSRQDGRKKTRKHGVGQPHADDFESGAEGRGPHRTKLGRRMVVVTESPADYLARMALETLAPKPPAKAPAGLAPAPAPKIAPPQRPQPRAPARAAKRAGARQ